MLSKKVLTPFPKTQRRPIWKRKGHIPMAQIYDEVIVFVRVQQGASIEIFFFVKYLEKKKNIFIALHPTPKGPCGGFWSPPDAYLF
jgi:hypothetical protein